MRATLPAEYDNIANLVEVAGRLFDLRPVQAPTGWGTSARNGQGRLVQTTACVHRTIPAALTCGKRALRDAIRRGEV